MMAVAAAMGLAASAGVIEVKFTVKTDVNNKVASKVIAGLYDQETGKHVFWTREKSANVPVQNAYFGLVNDATVAKKVGQNAELIWGDEKNPENVLVAGAWGSDKSKSGQVAGMFNGKPATGTWSAKLNTKKSYADLLAKNKVTQTENREQGVIGAAEADVAAAAKKAADEIAAAKAEGEAAAKAAEEKSADEIAAAKAEAEAAVKAAEEKAAAEIAAAKAEADKALDAKKAELDAAAAMMKTLADSFKTIDDPDMPHMFSAYLKETQDMAVALTNSASVYIDDAEEKYKAYATAIDADALNKAVEGAQAAVDAARKDVDAAQATVDALSMTNMMISVVDADALEEWFVDETNRVQRAIVGKKGELDAAVAGFDSYTNTLATVRIPELESVLDGCYMAMTNALAVLEQAQADLDKVLAGGYAQNFSEFCEANGWSEESVDAHLAYEEFKKNAKKDAEDDVTAKSARYGLDKKAYEEAQKALEDAKEELNTAIKTGKNRQVEDIEKKIKDLEQELADLPGKYKFWHKDFKYSDADREEYLKQEEKAEEELTAKQEVLDEAADKLLDAEYARDNQDTAKADCLDALEDLLDDTLTDADGKALALEAIREKVDAYEAKYIGYRDAALNVLDAIEQIQKDLEDWGKDSEEQPETAL